MLREEIIEQWKKLKKSFSALRSKSLDRFKGKLIRNICSVELRPDTYGEGFSEWSTELLCMRGFWDATKKANFTQKMIIYFEVQEISEVLEMLEDQTEEDRKFLRTKLDGSLPSSNHFSETNLTSWFSISTKKSCPSFDQNKAKLRSLINQISDLKSQIDRRRITVGCVTDKHGQMYMDYKGHKEAYEWLSNEINHILLPPVTE